MLRNKYRAFEIKDNQVSQTLVDGEPFLIGLSKMFVFCGDKAFLDRQLIPYLRSMGG